MFDRPGTCRVTPSGSGRSGPCIRRRGAAGIGESGFYTGTAAPLTAADASPHRNATVVAIRAGGTRFFHSSSGIAARLAGVSIWVGRIALQRTPSGLPSAATDFANAITAALDAQ